MHYIFDNSVGKEAPFVLLVWLHNDTDFKKDNVVMYFPKSLSLLFNTSTLLEFILKDDYMNYLL